MLQQHALYILRLVCLGLLVWAVVFLAGWPRVGGAHDEEDEKGGQHQAARGCRGFVILPNGFAVLSSLPAPPAPGNTGAPQRGGPADVPGDAQAHPSGASPHLLGYTHGQAIVPQEAMLCVPVVSAGTLQWTALGHGEGPTITLEVPKGALTLGRRARPVVALLTDVLTLRRQAPVVFTLLLQQKEVVIAPAHMRVLARMPHHDRGVPGGHGPANDPAGQGLVAQPVGPGRYTIPALAFTMAGPWLLEVQIQQGTIQRTVYLAAAIDEAGAR